MGGLYRGCANKNAVWHCACVIAWQFWNAPSGQARLLRCLQARRCGETGGRLWNSAEVDHRVPLFRVWSEYRDAPWPELLDYWGLPNLQVINRDAHVAKCATEAGDRHTNLRVAAGRWVRASQILQGEHTDLPQRKLSARTALFGQGREAVYYAENLSDKLATPSSSWGEAPRGPAIRFIPRASGRL